MDRPHKSLYQLRFLLKLPADSLAADLSTEDLIPAVREPLPCHSSSEACCDTVAREELPSSISPRPATPAACPPPVADPLQAQLQNLERQAALLGLDLSPAKAPGTPEPEPRQPRAARSSSSAVRNVDDHLEAVFQLLQEQDQLQAPSSLISGLAYSDSSSSYSSSSYSSDGSCSQASAASICAHSRAAEHSVTSQKAEQRNWYLPSAVRVDATELEHPGGKPVILGQGGMGSVSLMQDNVSGQLVAVKEPHMSGDSELQEIIMTGVQREHAINELVSAHGLQCVVEYMGPVEEDGELTGALVFANMPGGSLHSNWYALACFGTTSSKRLTMLGVAAHRTIELADRLASKRPVSVLSQLLTGLAHGCRQEFAAAALAVRHGILLDTCRAMTELHEMDMWCIASKYTLLMVCLSQSSLSHFDCTTAVICKLAGAARQALMTPCQHSAIQQTSLPHSHLMSFALQLEGR